MNVFKNTKPQLPAREVIGFLFSLRAYAPRLTAGMAVSQIVGATASSAIAPLFVSRLLTRIANGTANLQNSVDLLIGYVISLIVGEIISVRVTIALAYYAENRMMMRVAERVLQDQMRKSLNFHANHMSGGIVSDATKLNGTVERFWDTIMFTAIPIVTTIVSITIALLFFVWQYAIVLLVVSVCIAFFVVRGQNKMAPLNRAVSEKNSAVTAYLADVIANMGTVKAFAGHTQEITTYRGRLEEWRQASMKEMKSVLIVTGSFGVLMTALNAVAFIGAVLVTEHHLAPIGPTYLVIGYTLNIVAQLWQINGTTRNYIRILGDAAPMIAMLKEKPELSDPDKPEKVRISRGEILFDKVCFRHEGSHEPIFNKLDLKLKPGEKVGLVGHSGSGKTTLTRLLLRFSDIQKGAIKIDGQDIAKITQDDLRRNVAYVPQEPLLFHRSIRENIRYGQPDASDEAIEGVAKMASAHGFIQSLPQGYDTLVGERGVKLSGGQRQRIAIARAMLKNAPILVLDEATSALDSESEAVIQDSLWALMEGRTAMVIAHRLSTIQQMDRIIVLDNGRIVEQGSHKELLHANGTYARLWNRQSGGFIED